MKKTFLYLVLFVFVTSTLYLDGSKVIHAENIDTIPNTSREVKDYDQSFLSVTGFASLGVKDRTSYEGTSYHREISNEREFLQALLDARTGSVKVIEVMSDLNLGWHELNLSDEERKKYSFITKYSDPSNGYTNPVIAESGVSKLSISDVNGLTIFSENGEPTIKHVEFKLNRSSNDIVIRNLNFDGMWQWDDTQRHKEVGWTFIKVNGANNVWIDHNTFSIASDGLIDIENGSTNVTLSWNEIGLAASENPDPNGVIYPSIKYMEEQYIANNLKSDSTYYQMRNEGATKEQIMAYAAYHSKVHLNGSGDKDYVNYVSSNGNEIKDGNQRIRLTIAYSHYQNVGQRVPMIRQGSGHLYNTYLDNSSHIKVLDNVNAIATYARDTLSRALNARNGASIAADTTVFNGFSEPIIGAEIQGLDTKNMDEQWAKLFQHAYNRNLIVNSKVTNKYGSYIGSSWDNNGENLFTKGFTWHDKSTIGNWAWSSHIVGSENMSKTDPPSEPFTFEYRYEEKLPYTYEIVPLEKVVSTVTKYAGAGKVTMSPTEWLTIHYDPVVQDIINLVTQYQENDDIINDRVAHLLSTQLNIAKKFEQKRKHERVASQMRIFKKLVDQQYKRHFISKYAYDTLRYYTERLLNNQG
ncbi:FIMAH domain-containing protein [Gracilibacillus dipsosauri]|uniref:FIMAH domain-containing protein n=1 Tax=Gracilibacillus dipsosauri TaxID=178340 RepID=UPI0015E86ED0|nr:hypothetical protein [Gracilibacillus dipsosauri]